MPKKKAKKNFQAVPLKGSFMVLAIIGFFISAYLIFPRSTNWGVSFMIVFVAMLISAMISMTKAPIKV